MTAPTTLERLCIQGGPYVTPAGFYDVPYIYSKSYFFPDSSPFLFSGISPIQLQRDIQDTIQVDGDSDFILRKIGTNFLFTAGFNFQDALSYYYFSNGGVGIPGGLGGIRPSGPLVIAPEKMFPGGSAIRYTIGAGTEGFALAYNGADPPYIGYFTIYFQGVKRYRGVQTLDTSYKYWERMFTYVFPFNLNWTYLQSPFTDYTPSPTHYFNQVIDNYDFELQQIGIMPNGNDTFGYQLQLFDQAQVMTSNEPVTVNEGLSGNGGFIGGLPTQSSNNAFPVPSLLYPQNSNIRFGIRSLADTSARNVGGPETIYFKGVQRIPC